MGEATELTRMNPNPTGATALECDDKIISGWYCWAHWRTIGLGVEIGGSDSTTEGNVGGMSVEQNTGEGDLRG